MALFLADPPLLPFPHFLPHEGKRYEFRESDDVHDVAGLFRLWLHSLPEPIVPHEYYGKLIECGKSTQKLRFVRNVTALAPQYWHLGIRTRKLGCTASATLKRPI